MGEKEAGHGHWAEPITEGVDELKGIAPPLLDNVIPHSVDFESG